MRISFDFDGTLSQESIQVLAETLNNSEFNELFIVTSRVSKTEWNKDLFSVAEFLGIPRNHIFFTEGDFKWKTLKELNIELHFDDDYMEIKEAKQNGLQISIVHICDSVFNN